MARGHRVQMAMLRRKIKLGLAISADSVASATVSRKAIHGHTQPGSEQFGPYRAAAAEPRMRPNAIVRASPIWMTNAIARDPKSGSAHRLYSPRVSPGFRARRFGSDGVRGSRSRRRAFFEGACET